MAAIVERVARRSETCGPVLLENEKDMASLSSMFILSSANARDIAYDIPRFYTSTIGPLNVYVCSCNKMDFT